MNKVLTYTAMAVAILGLCGIATISIQAEEIDGDYPPIVQNLAERFNLNVDEVKGFFDQNRGERMLNRLAETGVTQEQIETLQVKKRELREECLLLKDLPQEERRAKMQESKEEMKDWAEENGIDLSILGGLGGRHGKGFGKGLGYFGQQIDQ
jgi:Spy/CpxP family protein refolding chaperone